MREETDATIDVAISKGIEEVKIGISFDVLRISEMININCF